MSGANFMDELDCGSFFNHMDDDLIEFPVDNGCNDFHSIWTDNSNILPLSDDPIFFGGNSKTASDLSPELSVPREEIAHLDWLSNFLEDSFAGQGLTINNGAYPFKESAMARHQFQISSPVSVLESSSSSTTSSSSSCSGGKVIPLNPTQHGIQRARSKRPRPATFIPRRAIHLVSPTPEHLLIPVPVLSSGSENLLESHSIKTEQQQQKKKRKLKPSLPSENAELNQNQNQNQPRKCMHCEITKTPQWRAGPMGPKTLCNACGVRYKSGRLFPEYRPAASPTFVPSIHSNSHKKVAEMRAKGTENAEADPQLIPNSNASADHQ